MKRYINYLKYIIKHKWFVLIAGYRINAPFFRIVFHDTSKFLPREFLSYAKTFYSRTGKKQYIEDKNFKLAWLLHQHRNPHHWQYWILKEDSGKIIPIEIPKHYALEMIADWMGAGRAITGKWDCKEWYNKNKNKIIFNEKTREFVESIINKGD